MTNAAQQNYSFWELIEKYPIEIPIIQRDYAQGRSGDKTENIRSEFVNVLRDALLPDVDKLHLNFVYGKVSKGRFVPLDGQQRLTTLFLLHWYLAKVSANDSDEVNKQLKRFSYHTRPSSRDFCEALVKSTFSNDIIISTQIKDASWFFDYWKKDPTVEAMLNMLDTIQVVFNEETPEKLEKYWNRLTAEKQIHFEFLDLEEFNLTDELYVKMNARGKPLSEFENFKAWLMEYVEEHKLEEEIDIKDWKHRLDTKWADLFWNNKGEKEFTIDQAYMNFFRNMFQIFYVQGKDIIQKENKNLSKKHKLEKEAVLEKARKLVFNKNDDFISNDFYISLKILEECINPLFNVIDVFAKHEVDVKISNTELDFFRSTDNSVFKDFVSNDATYADKTRFYAMSQYLVHQKGDFDREKFISWMRIFRNLTINSNIDLSNFYNVLKSIDKLAIHSEDISKNYNQIKTVVGFNSIQVKEEERKAKLINDGIIKKSDFLNFENHSYFRGQVEFLLEMSNEDEGKFLEYGEKIITIFTYKLRKEGDKEYLLERALLTIDKTEFNKETGYLMKIPSAGNKWSLLKMYNRENKKEVLTWRDNFLLNNDMRKLFRLLLDRLSTGDENELLGLIKKNEKELSGWRYYMVSYPIHFQYCLRGVIRFVNKDNIIIYSKRSANTHRRELYSSSFYETYFFKWKNKELNISPFTKFRYHSVTNSSDTACACIDHFFTQDKKNHYTVDISFEEAQYHIKFFNRNKNDNGEHIIEDEIYDKLIGLKEYNFEEKVIHTGILKQITKVDTQEEAVNCVKAICIALKPKTP